MDLKQHIIQIFLEDGLAKGLRSVVIENWNGEAIVCPRKNIGDLFRRRKEIRNKVALYFLIGDSEDGLNNVYIGEADGIRSRLKNHHLNKDWWREVVIFFSQSNRLTKAHVKYLESRCISMAKKAGKCNLENSNNPSKSSLPRTDISVMNNFYSKISLVLPLLGYDILEAPREIKGIISEQKKEIKVFCRGRGVEAEGIYTNEGKIQVFKRSKAVKDIAPAFHNHNYNRLRNFLIKEERIVNKDKYYEFTEDYLFNSLSAAAAVILGNATSGPRQWKNSKGKSIKELEEKL